MVNRIAENVPILNDDEKTANRYGSTETNKDHWHESRLSYPRAVIFVLASKFFEAFAANGVRTVLALYLRDSLKFSEESATSFYHIFNFFSQFCPIFGAVLADSYFGNAKTIFYLNFLYAIGWIGMVTLTFPLGNISIAPFVLLSLILISIGNGSIRACITSLGGSQFKLPQQSHQLDRYFSHYYFIYTMGIMLSKVFPPSIRSHAKCFGANECYTAVFGALGVIFLISWLVFLVGLFYYEHEDINRSDGNVLFQVIGCIFAGATKRIRGCYFDRITDNSWIDGAIGKYTESFVTDVAAFLRVLKLFLPLPIYWALFAQIDSSWTFQASQLNTTVFGFEFEADQAKAMGASMLLIMIPVWQNAIVPMILLWKVEIDPLTSVMFGGICASLSFVCSGILQVMIDQNGLKWFSILWQLPQFFLIMMGEVLLSIPGLQFAFTQAPPSMKSVMTAAWFCNNAFGNLIVVFVTEVKIIKSQSGQYFLYATLMLVGILIFRWLAVCYRYSETYDEETSLMPNKRKHSTQSVDYFRSQENLDLIL